MWEAIDISSFSKYKLTNYILLKKELNASEQNFISSNTKFVSIVHFSDYRIWFPLYSLSSEQELINKITNLRDCFVCIINSSMYIHLTKDYPKTIDKIHLFGR